jgi:hypothetical protein
MEHEEMESRLKSLPLREPSDRLERRMNDLLAPPSGQSARPPFNWLRLAPAMGFGAAGFMLGLAFHAAVTTSDRTKAPAVTEVIYVIEPRSAGLSSTFAVEAGEEFLADPEKVKVIIEPANESA